MGGGMAFYILSFDLRREVSGHIYVLAAPGDNMKGSCLGCTAGLRSSLKRTMVSPGETFSFSLK